MRVFLRDWLSDMGLLPVPPTSTKSLNLNSLLQFTQTFHTAHQAHKVSGTALRDHGLPDSTYPYTIHSRVWLDLTRRWFGWSKVVAMVYWDFFCTVLGRERCVWGTVEEDGEGETLDPLMLDILLLTFNQLQQDEEMVSTSTSMLPVEIAMGRGRAYRFWKKHAGWWVYLVGVLRRGGGMVGEVLDGVVYEEEMVDALDRVFFGVGTREAGTKNVTVMETATSAHRHYLNDVGVVESVGAYLGRSLTKEPRPSAGKIQGVVAWMMEERVGTFRKLRVTENGVAVGVEDCGDGPWFMCDPILVTRKRNQTLLIPTATLQPKPPTLHLHRLTNTTVHILGPLQSLHVTSLKSSRVTTGPVVTRLHVHRCIKTCVAGVAGVVTVEGVGVEVGVATMTRPLVWTGEALALVSASLSSSSAATSSSESLNEPQEKPVKVVIGPLDTWYEGLGDELDALGWDRSGKKNRWDEGLELWKFTQTKLGDERITSCISLLPPSQFFPSEIPIQINASSSSTPIPIPPPAAYSAFSEACLAFVTSAKSSISIPLAVSAEPVSTNASTDATPSIVASVAPSTDLGDNAGITEKDFKVLVEERFHEWISKTGRVAGMTSLIALGKDLMVTLSMRHE